MQSAVNQPQFLLESELEWLCYQLWTKTTARAPTFSFNIADTIILRQGTPQTWYFSTKEGYILKKNYQNVRLPKINKSFNKKNGMSLNSAGDMPAATTFTYKPQRNTDTGEERLALSMGYVSGSQLLAFMRAAVSDKLADGRPNIIQAFVPPRLIKNSVIKVVWTQASMEMRKITNKLPIVDERYSTQTRTVTCEDESQGFYTQTEVMPNAGPIYEHLLKALLEIHGHIKKNSDIMVTGGNFYFKLDPTVNDEKPTLLFATQIKTERPILILNPSIQVALTSQENRILFMKQQVRGVAAFNPKQLEQVDEVNYMVRDISLPDLDQNNEGSDVKSNNIFNPPVQQHDESQEFYSEAKKIPIKEMGSTSMKRTALPPKPNKNLLSSSHQASHSSRYGGGDQCPFCFDPLQSNGSTMPPFEITVNQIVKLYEFFELSPAGLLILPANSQRQQKFFEDFYAQVAQNKILNQGQQDSDRQSQRSKSSQSKVPAPLQKAFNLTSVSKYTMLRNDPSFIYKSLKICHLCYESVKAMLSYQSKEQINKARQQPELKPSRITPAIVAGVSKGTPRRLDPIKQGWMQPVTSDSQEEENEIPQDSMTELDQSEGCNKNAQVNSMFSKVQAGREINQGEENFVKSISESTDQHNRDAMLKNDEALSLEIGNSSLRAQNKPIQSLHLKYKNKAGLQNQVQALNYYQNKTTTHSKDNVALSYHIQNMKALEQKSSNMNRAFGQRKPQSAKYRQEPSNVAQGNGQFFNNNEKRQLKEARRSLKQQNESNFQEQMYKEHRILMNQNLKNSSEAQQQQSCLLQNAAQRSSTGFLQSNFDNQKVLGKQKLDNGFQKKMRPISAKPFFGNFQQSKLKGNNPNLSEVDGGSTNVIDSATMQQYPSMEAKQFSELMKSQVQFGMHNIVQSGPASQQYQQQIKEDILVNRYTNKDAARIYLNSIKSGDINVQSDKQIQPRKSQQPPKALTRPGLPFSRRPKSKERVPPATMKVMSHLKPNHAKQAQQQYPTNILDPAMMIGGDFKKRKASSKISRGAAMALKKQTIDMFNYQSNNTNKCNDCGQTTNIVVPSKDQVQQIVEQDSQQVTINPREMSPLAEGLKNLQEMPMSDIDQIAANADNLIEILQGIKEKKLQNDLLSNNQQQDREASPIVSQDTQSFPALMNEQVPQKSNRSNADLPYEQIVARPVQPVADQNRNSNNDFWDNHTHSPLQNQVAASRAPVKDFWADDNDTQNSIASAVIRPPTDESHIINNQEQDVAQDNWHYNQVNRRSLEEMKSDGMTSNLSYVVQPPRFTPTRYDPSQPNTRHSNETMKSAIVNPPQMKFEQPYVTAQVTEPVEDESYSEAPSGQSMIVGPPQKSEKSQLRSPKKSPLRKMSQKQQQQQASVQTLSQSRSQLKKSEVDVSQSLPKKSPAQAAKKFIAPGKKPKIKITPGQPTQQVNKTDWKSRQDKPQQMPSTIKAMQSNHIHEIDDSADTIPDFDESLPKPAATGTFEVVRAHPNAVIKQKTEPVLDQDFAASASGDTIPDNLMDRFEQIIQQRVKEELSKSLKESQQQLQQNNNNNALESSNFSIPSIILKEENSPDAPRRQVDNQPHKIQATVFAVQDDRFNESYDNSEYRDVTAPIMTSSHISDDYSMQFNSAPGKKPFASAAAIDESSNITENIDVTPSRVVNDFDGETINEEVIGESLPNEQVSIQAQARVDAEIVEKARIEAELAEKARIEAENEAEKARVQAEADQKARINAEKARVQAEIAEKTRIKAEQARVQAEADEKARFDAEQARVLAEAAQKQRADAEQAELARIQDEADKAKAAEKSRIEAETAEKARVEAEQAEKARIIEAEAEQQRIVAAEAEAKEKARLEAEDLEKARLDAEALEQARVDAEVVEQARIKAEAEAQEKAKIEAEAKEAAEQVAEKPEANDKDQSESEADEYEENDFSEEEIDDEFDDDRQEEQQMQTIIQTKNEPKIADVQATVEATAKTEEQIRENLGDESSAQEWDEQISHRTGNSQTLNASNVMQTYGVTITVEEEEQKQHSKTQNINASFQSQISLLESINDEDNQILERAGIDPLNPNQIKAFNVLYKYAHASCAKVSIMSGYNTPSEANTQDEKAIFDNFDTDQDSRLNKDQAVAFIEAVENDPKNDSQLNNELVNFIACLNTDKTQQGISFEDYKKSEKILLTIIHEKTIAKQGVSLDASI